jgi:hypothetical protein
MDDKRDVEREVKRPAINSWTENDPPDEMKKKKSPPKAAKQDGDLENRPRPGTGRPDAEETHRQRLQRSK